MIYLINRNKFCKKNQNIDLFFSSRFLPQNLIYEILSQNLSQCFENFTEPKKIIARHFHQYREASNEKHALLNTHTPSTTTHTLQLSSSDPRNIFSPKHLIPETSDPRNIFSSFDLKYSI